MQDTSGNNMPLQFKILLLLRCYSGPTFSPITSNYIEKVIFICTAQQQVYLFSNNPIVVAIILQWSKNKCISKDHHQHLLSLNNYFIITISNKSSYVINHIIINKLRKTFLLIILLNIRSCQGPDLPKCGSNSWRHVNNNIALIFFLLFWWNTTHA